MSVKRLVGHDDSRKGPLSHTRARRRIESLERAAQLYRRKLAWARMRDRALATLSDAELEHLVEWLRALTIEGEPTDLGFEAWRVYQSALAQERTRSLSSNGAALGSDRPRAEAASRGGAHA